MSFLTQITNETTNGTILEDKAKIAGPFDYVATLKNLSRGANAGPDAIQDTSTLQPVSFGLIDGKGYLKLDGTTGCYASVPSSTDLDVLGDIDIQATFPNIESNGMTQTFMGRYASGSNVFLLQMTTSRTLYFYRFTKFITSSAPLSEAAKGVRATHRVSDDRVQFFETLDGTVWTQVGTDQTLPANTPFAGTSNFEVGTWSNGGNSPLAGAIQRCIVKDGIDGTPVLDIDFTDTGDLHGAATITATTGQTVTMNGTALLLRGPYADFDTTAGDYFNWVAPAITDGTLIVATKNGTYSGTVDMTAAANYELSAMGFTTDHARVDEDFVGVYLGPLLTADEKASAIAQFVKQGAVESFSGVTSFATRFRYSRFKTFDAVDSSNVTDFNNAFYTCDNLESFPLIDTSQGVNFGDFMYANRVLTYLPDLNVNLGNTFRRAFQNCNLLVNFPAGFFDSWAPAGVANACFDNTWDGCNSLSATSVLNILNSIDFSGIYGTNSGLVGGTALADAVIDIDYDNAETAPDITTVEASLLAKGWTVNLTAI